MKKLLAIILALSLLLSLGACTKRPDAAPDTSVPQSSSTLSDSPAPSESTQPEEPETSPEAAPTETPQPSESEPAGDEEPFEESDAEPAEEPDEQPSDEPADANQGSATISSTATDLAPADNSYLELIPRLPFENWASTALKNGVMLELSGLGADAAQALQDYLEELREEDFEVTEYLSGVLYEAKKDGLSVKLMLEGGVFTVTIEKA